MKAIEIPVFKSYRKTSLLRSPAQPTSKTCKSTFDGFEGSLVAHLRR